MVRDVDVWLKSTEFGIVAGSLRAYVRRMLRCAINAGERRR